MVLSQFMLVLAACATAGAALRVATRIAAPAPTLSGAGTSGTSGTSVAERVLIAACLAAAFLVCWTLALGVMGLSGSVAVLVAGPVLAWVAARWLVPAPSWSIAGELVRRWDGASRTQRVATLALAGAAAGCVIEVGRQPSLGLDALEYHLAEVVGWLHSGHAGAVQTISYDFPYGYYPVTNELLLTWVLGISRSFAPLVAWSSLAASLALLAMWRLLELLRVPRLLAAAALAAFATLPILAIGLNVDGAGTDLPAVTWLACTAALSAGAAVRPALLGPALLAAGLGVGTKTTVAPLAALALLAGAWTARDGLSSAYRWLAAGAAGALLAGGTWYIRNTVDHGWPLWPFSSGPTGDPQPHIIALFHQSFLSRPGASVSASPSFYLEWVAGGLGLILGALAIPLLAGSRAARLWAALAIASVLAWAAAPFTGAARNALVAPADLSTVRYLLAPFGACAVALAIGTRDGTALSRRLAIALLGAASAGSLVADASLGYPVVPRLQYLVAGAVSGAVVGAIWTKRAPSLEAVPSASRTRRRPSFGAVGVIRVRRRALAPATLRVAGALLAGALLVAGAPGWLGREARDASPDSPVLAFMLTQPGFSSGSKPVAFAPMLLATLAGPRLRHPVSLIPAREPCGRVRARLRRGWIVIQPMAFLPGITSPFDAAGCLRPDHPVYDDRTTLVYAPVSTR